MDCPRCGAPLTSRDTDCRYCGRGRDEASGQARDVPTIGSGLELMAIGPNKISVIKAIREATGLGLKEAKDLSEAPLPIRFAMDPIRARRALAEFQKAGAKARAF